MSKQVWLRFIKNKATIVGGLILLIFFFMALFGPILIRNDPNEIDLLHTYQPPSKGHLLGTDNLGRDMFARLVVGARMSLLVSFTGTVTGSLIGVILGIIAGYFGKMLDAAISRFVDMLLAFPGLLMAIMVVAILGNGVQNTIWAIAFYSIPYIARIVRGVTLTLRESEYVQACLVMGASNSRIILTHIVPNSMSQIIVNITLNLGTSILTASSLSFLGLGVTPPHPEWGAMLSQGREVIRQYPLAAIIPGVAITLVVLSFSIVGDGLRDALDPRLKNS